MISQIGLTPSRTGNRGGGYLPLARRQGVGGHPPFRFLQEGSHQKDDEKMPGEAEGYCSGSRRMGTQRPPT